jgi:hypothetical protein
MATVSYVPNDPLASGGPPSRSTAPRNFPPGDVAKFDVEPAAAPGKYQPHTPEFQFWQAKLALIGGLKTWRQLDGSYLKRWYGDQSKLPVKTDAGDDLNAFYDRSSLQFFSHTFGGVTVNSAESVDIVTHEQGHAFLDAIRPDFFQVPFIEVGALHESFGDCMALVNALEDRLIRDAVLKATPDLSGNQFVEGLAEALGDAIAREYGASNVDTGALRRALNAFQWSDPTTLPPDAPANKLSGEVHSFSRVFTGAFYDVIRNVYNAGNKKGSMALRKASRTAGKLLVAAVRVVPAAPNTFRGVGQRMVQADVTMNKGVDATAISDAFAAHGLTLPAPAMSLPVPLPGQTRSGAAPELRRRLGVPSGTRIELTPVDTELHGEIAHVSAYRPVPLDGVGLQGVQVLVPGVARVATTRRGRSITGVLGEVTSSEGEATDQARAFARSLVANGDVRTPPRTARRLAAAPQAPSPRVPHTASHEIRLVGGQPTLVRVGFTCRR